MVNFGYPYNDIVICKDSTDYLGKVGLFYRHFVSKKTINAHTLGYRIEQKRADNFSRSVYICMLRHSMLCIAKVFGGKFLRENFEKWGNLVRLGVFFDQMILKIIPKITIFK